MRRSRLSGTLVRVNPLESTVTLIDLPDIGPVGALREKHRPDKTRRHFYAPWERWEQVSSIDPQPLYRHAFAQGCPRPVSGEAGGRLIPPECLPLLHRHHDEAYLPAYAQALTHPETRFAPKRRAPHKRVAYSPLGVFLVIGTGGGAVVVTAYRIPPKTASAPSVRDYVNQARWCFKRDSGAAMSLYDWSDVTFLLEEAHGEGVRDDERVWNLALATGLGGLLADTEERRNLMAVATQELQACPPLWRRVVIGAIKGPELAARLADAILTSDDVDEVEAALGQLEDGLLALHALGAAGELSTSLRRLRALLVRDGESVVSRELIEGRYPAGLHSSHPLRVVEGLLTDPRGDAHSAVWGGVTLAQLGESVLMKLDRWLDVGLGLQPVAVMGAEQDRWEISLREPPSDLGSCHIRIFACDEGHPEGYEITGHVQKGAPTVWQVDQPGDWVVIVTFISDASIPGQDLEALGRLAGQEGGIVERCRCFTRPS